MAEISMETVKTEDFGDVVGELTALLHACVHQGAAINFIMPFPKVESLGYWLNKIWPKLERGKVDIIVARQSGKIIGSVMLDVDLSPNQVHRGEVSKLLVHPDARRQGIGQKLMAALDDCAHARGLSLLVLDTRTGDSAEPLYTKAGYTAIGSLPDYSRDVFSDTLDATTFMYKKI